MKSKHFGKFVFIQILAILGISYTQEESEYIYQSYQRSITCTSMFTLREPRSPSEIQDIVRDAIAQNVNVKVIGNKHSVTDTICTSGIPVKLTHITHFLYDQQTQIATVGTGLEVSVFYDKLHQFGRAITGQPFYSGITVGGAIGTGAHGTGIKYPSTLSDQIVSISFVDGRGNVRKVTKDEENFKAFRVNLGLLGIIFEVEVATIPQYKLQIKHFPVTDGILWNGTDLVEMAKSHDHFQAWWFPSNKQMVLATGNHLPVYEPGNCETRILTDMSWLVSTGFSTVIEAMQTARDDIGLFHVQSYSKLGLFKEVPGREPIFVDEDGETSCLHGDTIGYSHRMLTNKCNECFWKYEGKPLLISETCISVPLNKLMPALRTISEVLGKHFTQFPMGGIGVRFLKAGDGFMAMNEGERDRAAIEWAGTLRWDKSQPQLGISAFQAIAQVLIEQYDGRAHWGKNGLYYSNPQIIRKSHPNLDKFIAAMNEYDPQELFMNTLGERIKHGRYSFTVTPEISKHCALNELCICENNFDCGNNRLIDYTCGTFLGFPRYNVCLPGTVEQLKSGYSRTVIEFMATLEYNEDTIVNYLGQYKALKNVLVYKKKKHPSVKGADIYNGTTNIL